MNFISNPKQKDWPKLAERAKGSEKGMIESIVQSVFNRVKKEGDQAVLNYTKKFDQIDLSSMEVSEKELKSQANKVALRLQNAIALAFDNIKKFHQAQEIKKQEITTTKGVVCWREQRGIDTVGLYIPGGTAPLFSSLLMLGIPAQLARCGQIIICTPPDKSGEITPSIAYVATLLGKVRVFKVGGAQAIAAMTFGTESIPKVDKIFGPGNRYVTTAKQLATNYNVAIDMPAGPSEVLVIADESSNPEFVAADLLSQAEHGDDSQVILLATNEQILEKTMQAIQQQLKNLPRAAIAKEALNQSRFLLFNDIKEAFSFSNYYAPEHLILALENPRQYIPWIQNAGSVFLGNYSCESAGDYASGTNHTLPTNGFAKNYSGVSLDSFVKKITFQELSKEGIQNIGPAIEILAEAEGLAAHKYAVSIRLKTLKNV